MSKFKKSTRRAPGRGSNVVHRLELPQRTRRARRRTTGDAVLIPQPPPPARVEPPRPAPAPATPPAPTVVPHPEPLHDSQARHQIELLERRLLKMARLLERKDQDAAREAAPVEGGVASIYRDVQGVDEEDGQAEQKQALMSRIFEQNLKLRERVTSAWTGAR